MSTYSASRREDILTACSTDGSGATARAKYPVYYGLLVAAQNSVYDRFPQVANGWGTIHPIPDKTPPLQTEEGATNLERTNLISNPHHRFCPTA
jgi:hypothetical protein